MQVRRHQMMNLRGRGTKSTEGAEFAPGAIPPQSLADGRCDTALCSGVLLFYF